MRGNRGTLGLFYYTINELNSVSKLPTITKYLPPLLLVLEPKHLLYFSGKYQTNSVQNGQKAVKYVTTVTREVNITFSTCSGMIPTTGSTL